MYCDIVSHNEPIAIPLLQAIERMKQEVGEGKELKVEYLLVDLASFVSLKDFVKTFKEKNLPLHILINNAAVCGTAFCEYFFIIPVVYTV